MSIKKGIFSFIFLCSAVFTGYALLSSKKPPKIAPSVLQSQFTARGVIDRVIQLRLNFDKAASNTEKVEITADVTLPFDFDDKLFFRWKLGQDVFLVEGELNGQLNGLLKQKPKKIRISVRGFSAESNHHVGFEIYGIKNGRNIYADGLIASDLENTFENTVQHVEKLKASQ